MYIQQVFFCIAAVFCLTPWASPPLALALGICLALTLGHPFRRHNPQAVRYLLQASVVGLGFGMNFSEVVSAGKNGRGFTVFSILGTLAAGFVIGRALCVPKKISCLISAGTAICGGSAIAAVAPIIEADEKEVAVSLATVFVLNAVALFLFPWLGHLLGMVPEQFGLWSAIAIHDTSSVVGAAAVYGPAALKIATTVKLTRALWIVPIAAAAVFALRKKDAKIAFPYFILAFVAASVAVSIAPSGAPAYALLTRAAKTGLTLTLFLIGAGLTRDTVRAVGIMPFVQGVALWLIISVASLIAVSGLA